MGSMATIRNQLGLSAFKDLQADSSLAASEIETNKESRESLRKRIDGAEDHEDAISSELLAKSNEGTWTRFWHSVNPFHHDNTDELLGESKVVHAGIEHDETKLSVLGEAQKEQFDAVVDSQDKLRKQLDALQEIDRHLERAQKLV